MKSLLKIVLVLTILFGIKGSHIHPRSMVQFDEIRQEEAQSEEIVEIDGMTIEEIRNIRPSRFVPINNVLFFNSYPPCEEGFDRDILGICREVWD